MRKGRGRVVLSRAILLACCACAIPSDHLTARPAWTRPAQEPEAIPRSGRESGLNAPVRDLRFTHLTTNDGLTQDNIVATLQDHRGFMWFATGGGLNRYDGNTFVAYQNNPNDPNTLSGSDTQSLIEDDRGNLWIGTWGGGLDKFDPTTERFAHYRYKPDDTNSISGDRVKTLAWDSRGHLWVGTIDAGLNRFDPATETVTRYRNDSTGQFIGSVNSIVEDSLREIWFAGARGLFHVSPQTGQIMFIRPPANMRSLAADYLHLHKDKAGNLWMLAGSPIVALAKYDPKTERFTEYSFGEGAVGVVHSSIADDGQNGLWVASSQGLYHFDLQTEQFTDCFRHDDTNPDSLSDNKVVSIYRDRVGLLWIGTASGGAQHSRLPARTVRSLPASSRHPRQSIARDGHCNPSRQQGHSLGGFLSQGPG